MIAGLKPYPAMRDSGVPWLGGVPEHWAVRRLKHVFRRIIGGSTPSSADPTYWDGNIVWVTPADVSQTLLLRGSLRKITESGLRACSAEIVPAGSIVVTSRAPVGNVAIAETALCTNQGCKALVVTADVVIPMFGFHLLTRLKDELTSLATGTTFAEISTTRIGTVAMPVPPLSEQAAIVRFLDHADRRIRRYIRAKQKLIKLLEEQKQVIIHRAVTRGLDPSVRLKPSGVEWLGDVPEHWEINRVRYVFREVDKRSSDGSELHLSMSQRLGLVPSEALENRTLVSESYAGGKLCEVDDLVLNRLKAHLGVLALARHAGVISPDYTVLRPIDVEGVEYFERVLRSTACRHELRTRAKGIVEGFWRLYTDDLYDIRLPVPPPQERKGIVSHFMAETTTTEGAALQAEREIALLGELRTRLIADVVTGKLDVREAAAQLPDEIEEPEPTDDIEVECAAEQEAADDAGVVPEEAEA